MYFESTAKLTGDMLVKVDRMSMANSLEVRCPMLDTRLAELAARIPHAWKIHNGGGKKILLKALGDRLPASILERKKMGFGVPVAIWFRGPLRETAVGQPDRFTISRPGHRGADFVRRCFVSINPAAGTIRIGYGFSSCWKCGSASLKITGLRPRLRWLN